MNISTADRFLYISLFNGNSFFRCERLGITIWLPHPDITALTLSESYAVSAITTAGVRCARSGNISWISADWPGVMRKRSGYPFFETAK